MSTDRRQSHLTRPQTFYRQLVRLYPAPFRRHYEAPLIQLFDDIYRDIQDLPAPAYRRRLISMFADTLLQVMQEQYISLRNLTVNLLPTALRTRRALVTTIVALIITLPALALYLNKDWQLTVMTNWNRTQDAIAAGQEVYWVNGTLNAGEIDVVQNFLADYTDAKYNHTGRTDVGYDSPHAIAPITSDHDGKHYRYDLKTAVEGRYSSTDPSFDPLLCSTGRPRQVRYDQLGQDQIGQAVVLATFTGGDQPDTTALYQMQLVTASSPNGAWKITSVRCPTLDNATTRPYVLAYGPLDNSYWRRDLP